ncbi:MAG: DUF3987 domain-containing protein, partial [Silvanigrellaceae bacterium]|nr:DUF3987 domain-containing protein [Silvanigrellaceae bacterium]
SVKKAAFQNKLSKLEAAGNEQQNAEESPEPPIIPCQLIQEPTYEALIKLYQEGQPSLALFSDEGGRMLGGWGMNKENRLKTICGFSELWGGNPISRARAGEGFDKIYGKRLAFHLMAQPVVAAEIISDEVVAGQGFLARTLICLPKPLAGERKYVERNAKLAIEVQTFQERVKTLLQNPLSIEDKILRELNLSSLHLSADSRLKYIEFYNNTEDEMRKDGLFHGIRPFASKAPEHALRLAGVLSFFHDENSQEVSLEYMEHAIEIVKFYLREANRASEHLSFPKDLAAAEKTLNWLHDKKVQQVSLKDIYQGGPKTTRTRDEAQKVVSVLVKHGWMIPQHAKISTNNGKSSTKIWEVRYAEK